jgi:hypothetical protein
MTSCYPKHTRDFPTPLQDVAINLIFTVLGQRRCNRTPQEYAAVAAKLPPLKVLLFQVNELLSWMHSRSTRSGVPLPQICRFKAGDQRWSYEPYPRIISYETLRAALTVLRLRNPRRSKTLK